MGPCSVRDLEGFDTRSTRDLYGIFTGSISELCTPALFYTSLIGGLLLSRY